MPTAAKEIFEAQSRSLRELLSDNGLGLYLPPYQRPYGWGRDKVEKLLDDTLHGLASLCETPDSFTFLGTVITIHDVKHLTVQPIVKPDVPSKVLTVIDGQQRLSSLLIMLVGMHNLIRQRAWKVFGKDTPDPSDGARTQLYAETVNVLQSLGSAFYEKYHFGDSPIYPRLIRAFEDQWAKDSKHRKYDSPIAYLLYTYAVIADSEPAGTRPSDFKPKARPGVGEGEVDLTRRLSEIRSALIKLSQAKPIEELEALPELATLADGIELQRALFNHELDPTFCEWLKTLDDEPEAELVRLVMLASYAMNRIALTVVQGKDEDYAFTIFESLNTTGEPLTAFETFLPRVVMAESIQDYQSSEAHTYMSSVQGYLNRFDVGDKLQNATRDLLVTFALAESGKKLSKRLSDQRTYMKDRFERCKDSPGERAAFLHHLSATATFVGSTWDPVSGSRQLAGLGNGALTDTSQLCLAFLTKLGHTVTIAPMVRFYYEALQAADDEVRSQRIADFENALKAMTAFTVFWRSTRRGTGNIDSQYRAIMAGDTLTKIGPLARRWSNAETTTPPPLVDLAALKSELVARLIDSKHGDIPNLPSFIAAASALPLYTMNADLARFLLLAAYHDTTEDHADPGLIVSGKAGVSPCFTHEGWLDQGHLTIEHIAPKQVTSGWDQEFYTDKERVHRIGNLVLAPGNANSSLSSRPWTEKRVLYGALGASTAEEARLILQQSGITFAQSTEDLAQMSRYLPHLRALGARTEEWDPPFMERRAEVLLRLVYEQLGGWLDLSWSDSENDEIVFHAPDQEDLDEVEIELTESPPNSEG